MHGNNLVIARAPVIFRIFPSFSSSESTALTYFQVVATEEIFLRFNKCEIVFLSNVKLSIDILHRLPQQCYYLKYIIYIIYIIYLKMKAGGGGVCNMSIDNLTFDFCTFFFAEWKLFIIFAEDNQKTYIWFSIRLEWRSLWFMVTI